MEHLMAFLTHKVYIGMDIALSHLEDALAR